MTVLVTFAAVIIVLLVASSKDLPLWKRLLVTVLVGAVVGYLF